MSLKAFFSRLCKDLEDRENCNAYEAKTGQKYSYILTFILYANNFQDKLVSRDIHSFFFDIQLNDRNIVDHIFQFVETNMNRIIMTFHSDKLPKTPGVKYIRNLPYVAPVGEWQNTMRNIDFELQIELEIEWIKEKFHDARMFSSVDT